LFTTLGLASTGCGSELDFEDVEFDFPEPPAPPPAEPTLPEGPVIRATDAPPPVSGGTLAIDPTDTWMVAADSDRDRIYVLGFDGLGVPQLLRSIELRPGDEPGRLVFSGESEVIVVLRGADAVVRVDLVEGEIEERRMTCPEPRSVLAHGTHTTVACASGEVWTFAAGESEPIDRVFVARDLRDLVAVPNGSSVTTFRTAHVWSVETRRALDLEAHVDSTPRVAWRTRALSDGSLVVLHQEASIQEVSIDPGGYGSGSRGLECGGIVGSVVTRVKPDGESEPWVKGAAIGLAVDVAVDEDRGRIAVASPSVSRASQGANVLEFAAPETRAVPRCALPIRRYDQRSAIAVEYDSQGRLFIQTREPARVVRADNGFFAALSADSVKDTGHDLFHAVTRQGVACASCHPEGREDAHTWVFRGIGPRRSQNLLGGFARTAPFHWDGDFFDFGALVDDVFVSRMGGGVSSPEEADALRDWIDRQPALTPPEPADEALAERGRALFHDEATGCTGCHFDERFGGPGAFDVGTGGSFQVPALENLAYRAPYMHDGCALRLEERLVDRECGGGDAHGLTSSLGVEDRRALAAYLLSL
jgi:mono/diheme cytochrome c family protein